MVVILSCNANDHHLTLWYFALLDVFDGQIALTAVCGQGCLVSSIN
jgi:hypothetical protein